LSNLCETGRGAIPRISAEARSAAHWREGGEHPKPPSYLSKRAKAVWREIVEERPVDYFRSGARELLAQYCAMAAVQENNIRAMEEDPLNPEFQRLVRDMANSLNMTAAKLRLSIQSALRTDRANWTRRRRRPRVSAARRRCCLAATW
jgi:phage terminase small subunit